VEWADRSAVARRRGWERRLLSNLAIAGQGSALVRSARAFAALVHAGQRRESDAAPFIRHP
jgi:hypothetical protein